MSQTKDINLQQEYQGLVNKLDQIKSNLIREETQLETKKLELERASKKLEEVAGVTDLKDIEKLIKDIDIKLEALLEEANTILGDK